TTGALIVVWSAIWWTYLSNHADTTTDGVWYVCYGFLLSGLVLLVVGLAIGQISRNARKAELPPDAPNERTAQPAVTPPGTGARGGGPGGGAAGRRGGFRVAGEIATPMPPGRTPPRVARGAPPARVAPSKPPRR